MQCLFQHTGKLNGPHEDEKVLNFISVPDFGLNNITTGSIGVKTRINLRPKWQRERERKKNLNASGSYSLFG